MSVFTDYLNARRKQGQPMVPLSQPSTETPNGLQSTLTNASKFYATEPKAKVEQPQVDRSNPISSLAQLLGPTPKEREEQLAQLEKQRKSMTAWTALADGLRHLGNLYYTAKGARPQQFADPYKQINENYQRDKQNIDDAAAYRQKYAQQLYTLQRQANEDERKDILAKAQAKWYDTRDETARQKAELDKLKAARVIQHKDGSLWKYDPISGTLDELKESDPDYIELMKAKIAKENRMGYGRTSSSGRGKDNGTYGYEKTTEKYIDPKTGKQVTKTVRVPTTNGQPKGQEKPTTTVRESEKSAKKSQEKPATAKKSQKTPTDNKQNKNGKGTTSGNKSGFFNK